MKVARRSSPLEPGGLPQWARAAQAPVRLARWIAGPTHWAQRQLGVRLIIVYKFAKAPLMFGLAVWLTAAPGEAQRSLDWLAREIAEAGAIWARAGAWTEGHLTSGVMTGGAVLAWLDGVASAIEGMLLLSGRPWAEWIVIFELACLLPVELLAVESQPDMGRFIVLAVNAAIVFYLARRRVRRRRRDSLA